MRFRRGLVRASAPRTWPWLVLCLILLGVATSYSSHRIARDTYQYLIVIDITQSMNVADMKRDGSTTTRLEFAKSAIGAAIGGLPCGSEAGFGIFAGHRTLVFFTPVEVCDHYDALIDTMSKVNWRMAWEARSEVAKGLYSAIDAALRSGDGTRLVFLTDGHEAPPLNETIRPAFNGEPGSVAGFIGGIGGPAPSQIPHLDDNDEVVGYWDRDEVMQIDVYSRGRAATEQGEAMVGINMADVARRIALGQEHLSSLRETYLEELASRTGLDYLRVESPEGFVTSLHRDSYARRTQVLSDLGWIPATLAFACLAYCFVLQPLNNRHRREFRHSEGQV